MKFLGIDYGRRKIGLAVGSSDTNLTEPHAVIRFKNLEDAVEKVVRTAKFLEIDEIVLGISEGKTANETESFSEALKKELKMPINFQDESLSTIDAQEMSKAAGINRSKRKRMEDAFAAAIMLQGYLETN